MAAPPAKRQRKLVVLSSSDNDEETLSFDHSRSPTATSSAELTNSRSRRQQSSPTKSPAKTRARTQKSASASTTTMKKRKERTNTVETSPRSLHRFFQPATEEQRWSSNRPAAAVAAQKQKLEVDDAEEIEDDLIEDDYGSFDEIFEQFKVKEKTSTVKISEQQKAKVSLKNGGVGRSSRPQRRFILDGDEQKKGAASGNVGRKELGQIDSRPWPERYAPVDIQELAVHKRKVADVHGWLSAAFSSENKHKILVLHGPAGCGKTTTISLLSQALGFSIVEWKNPVDTEGADGKYTSLNAQFDEFLNRSGGFGSLDLSGSPTIEPTQGSMPNRIVLIEEFPSSMSWGSSALTPFRTSLRRYLASQSKLGDYNSADATPPVVIIISETRLATNASISDNLTMHRLLGPEIYTNPGTSTIEFNPVAPTFMRKALDLVLKKEARHSMRKRIPGPCVLKKFSELGDIRSAISSLEFFCLRGDENGGDWGGRVAAKAKSSSRAGDAPLTLMEKESLEIITQREASLGLFHAVGKVVYNKREDASLQEQPDFVAPPPHLQHLERRKVSLVSVEDLMNETSTDVQTFAAALHENYPPSCDGPSFTDSLNACIENLSDSDILGSESRPLLSSSRMGVGMARSHLQGYGASVDRLRQDEISFHIAVRGLLFSLPHPVRRRVEQGASGKRISDAYKMYFPTSQRLWKDIEEMDGLIGIWERHFLDPTNIQSGSNTRSAGVESWKFNQMNVTSAARGFETNQHSEPIRSMVSREEVLLHQLPYLSMICSRASQTRGLDRKSLGRITQFQGIRGPSDDIPEDLNDSEMNAVNDWSTDPMPSTRRAGRPGFRSSKTTTDNSPEIQEAVENLLLSDDEIED
ncbi:Rad17 cell cycle checkpoint protein-domain-containing protein [Talaromyces proteolyticus]|uniref:Rad17 cell cycle checkpoint protein-domain-containing protein n=1 Tax=Talaromyces proteolyticus TaxID=1131652 RepID=A0AAD4PUD6_9EURO|nr:Rad17 cell cycle checkpoint protein-domain-containing protein [Talaromyces proteolyticus]KAH8689210.1 Rad17 cell cycle checkpoint protein-domain-containing protein [Talaromyces proteolyticus]